MNENDKNEILIQFKGLTKKFGSLYAVSNIDLEIKRGEIVGFLGPNGAGKSTTMKMMAHLLRPTKGEIWIRNNGELVKLTSRNKSYLLDNVGFLIENPAFYGDMTARQILSYFARLKGYPWKNLTARVEEVVGMFGLSEWIDKKLKIYSKGMRQKIGILSAIIHDPDIVVLDEPQTGLDPKARKEVRDFLLKLKQMGKTVFLSSHLLYEISEIADRIAIISHGKLMAYDNLENLELSTGRSMLNIELLTISEETLDDLLQKLNEVVTPLTGLEAQLSEVKYNQDSEIFEVLFDGDPKTQHKIFRTLFENNFNIISFSVPKATLLEYLFINYTDEVREENE